MLIYVQTMVLFVVIECVGQSKWLLCRKYPQTLIDFHNIDEATRGPVGALLLIVKMRFRAILASIGALIIVVSLAFDPFTQQVLDFPYRYDLTSKVNTSAISSVSVWAPPGSAAVWISGSQTNPGLPCSSQSLFHLHNSYNPSIRLTVGHESCNLQFWKPE